MPQGSSAVRPTNGLYLLPTPRNVRKPSRLVSAVYPRKFHWIMSPRKASGLTDAFPVFPQLVRGYSKQWSRHMTQSLSQHCKLHSQCVLQYTTNKLRHYVISALNDGRHVRPVKNKPELISAKQDWCRRRAVRPAGLGTENYSLTSNRTLNVLRTALIQRNGDLLSDA